MSAAASLATGINRRMLRAALLDADLYEEVEADRGATRQASLVVVLSAVAAGIGSIHHLREYHGDLHTDNIIVQRYGLGFNLKLVDMFRWGTPKQENIQDDVCNLIRIFYDAVGGARHYAKLPPEAKDICCGLKRSLILKKFRTAGHLQRYLETIQWE